MFQVNIYIMTDIKGPRRRDGFYLYEIEVPTEKGPATRGIYPKEIKDATENRAELTGLVEALKRLSQPCELDIYTESAHIAAALEGNQRHRDKMTTDTVYQTIIMTRPSAKALEKFRRKPYEGLLEGGKGNV